MSRDQTNPLNYQPNFNLPGSPTEVSDGAQLQCPRNGDESNVDESRFAVPHAATVARVRRARSRFQYLAAPSFHSLPQLSCHMFGSLLVLMFAAAPLLARSPSVRFDTSYLVSCRDVTTEEFAAANPQERLVEGRFHVSAIVDSGQLPEDTQYVYRFINPTGRVRVVDYRPKTQQATAVAGNVSVEKKKENSKSLGLSVSGSFESLVRGTAGSDIGSKNSSSVRYELKPPMEVVLVAGTIERGTGVYFNMRPSPERSLEGSREFVIVMRVPHGWRGDMMYLRCEAQHGRRGKLTSRGVSRFVVGLHAEGDNEARLAAEELVLSEAQLRRTVAEHQKAIQKRSLPSLVHKVGSLLDVYDPRIPDTWLDRLIYGSTSTEYEFYGYLPQDVRRVADKFRQAKRRMYLYSGSRLAMR